MSPIAEIKIRPMEPYEHKYAYTQSNRISDITGFCGYYSCEVESDGPGWQTNWISYGNPRESFFSDFAEVKNALRTDSDFGPCLSSLVEMKKFCEEYPESKLRHIRRWDEYGFRIDTNHYTYLMRLAPVSFEMSCYIFGYDTEQLNDHINQAKEGIQFLHPLSGEALFRMTDGDQIGVRTPGKEFEKKNCRYVDGSTIEVDGKETTPNDFAIAMFLQNSEFFPLRQSLPRKCFYYDAPEDRIMEIEKGDLGMSVSVLDAIDAPGGKASLVESYNRQLGVTGAQVAAMHHGCGYSWADPEADPERDNHATYEKKNAIAIKLSAKSENIMHGDLLLFSDNVV